MTTVPNRDSLIASLKKSVQSLDAKTDRLNEKFDEWSMQLEGVRVTAFISLVRRNDPDSPDWQGGEDRWEIGWTKVKSVWQMAARKYRDDVEADHVAPWAENSSSLFEPPVGLVSAPRGVRILAVDRFDDVVAALGRELERYHQAIDTGLVPAKQIA